eukprot:363119-Chlamydomonas_euryale.AAC.6
MPHALTSRSMQQRRAHAAAQHACSNDRMHFAMQHACCGRMRPASAACCVQQQPSKHPADPLLVNPALWVRLPWSQYAPGKVLPRLPPRNVAFVAA